MELILNPYEGIGNIKIGMTKEEISTILNIIPETFEKSEGEFVDDFKLMHVYYNNQHKSIAFEIFPEIEVKFNATSFTNPYLFFSFTPETVSSLFNVVIVLCIMNLGNITNIPDSAPITMYKLEGIDIKESSTPRLFAAPHPNAKKESTIAIYPLIAS